MLFNNVNNINVSFDDMMNGCTCSPLTITDFRKYLIHRYSDEWYIDYCKKFKNMEKIKDENP